jgi:hypothetical protein
VPGRTSLWCFDWLYGKEIPSLKVEWATAPDEEYLDKSITLAYGNEPRLDFFYHQLCVVATFDNDFEGGKVKGGRRGRGRGGGFYSIITRFCG